MTLLQAQSLELGTGRKGKHVQWFGAPDGMLAPLTPPNLAPGWRSCSILHPAPTTLISAAFPDSNASLAISVVYISGTTTAHCGLPRQKELICRAKHARFVLISGSMREVLSGEVRSLPSHWLLHGSFAPLLHVPCIRTPTTCSVANQLFAERPLVEVCLQLLARLQRAGVLLVAEEQELRVGGLANVKTFSFRLVEHGLFKLQRLAEACAHPDFLAVVRKKSRNPGI